MGIIVYRGVTEVEGGNLQTRSEHVHELDACQRRLRSVEQFEPQYGTRHSLDGAMVLFHHIIHIPHLPDAEVSAVFFVVAFDGGFIVEIDLVAKAARHVRPTS